MTAGAQFIAPSLTHRQIESGKELPLFAAMFLEMIFVAELGVIFIGRGFIGRDKSRPYVAPCRGAIYCALSVAPVLLHPIKLPIPPIHPITSN